MKKIFLAVALILAISSCGLQEEKITDTNSWNTEKINSQAQKNDKKEIWDIKDIRKNLSIEKDNSLDTFRKILWGNISQVIKWEWEYMYSDEKQVNWYLIVTITTKEANYPSYYIFKKEDNMWKKVWNWFNWVEKEDCERIKKEETALLKWEEFKNYCWVPMWIKILFSNVGELLKDLEIFYEDIEETKIFLENNNEVKAYKLVFKNIKYKEKEKIEKLFLDDWYLDYLEFNTLNWKYNWKKSFKKNNREFYLLEMSSDDWKIWDLNVIVTYIKE